MNTRSLEYFLIVAEELNMTRAAERLFISQQALSEQIRKLESELNIELFSRGHGLTLTYSGRHLIETATQILSLERQLKNRIDDIHGVGYGELIFGLSYTRGRLILPRIFPILERNYPNLNIKVVIEPVHTMEKLLLSGVVDIAMGFEDLFESPRVTKILISAESMHLIVHHRLLMKLFGNRTDEMIEKLKQGVDLRLFNNQKFLLYRRSNYLRNVCDNLLQISGINYEAKFEESHADILMLLARQDLGISFLPHMLMVMQAEYFRNNGEETLHAFPFGRQAADINVVAAHLNDRYTSRFSRVLVDIIKDEYQAATIVFNTQNQPPKIPAYF